MISKEFIESGILSMYVLGATTQEEQQEVERMTQLYPEIKAELLELQSAIDDYAYQFEVPPAPHIKKNIEEKIFSSQNIFKNEIQENNIKKRSILWKSYSIAAVVAFLC